MNYKKDHDIEGLEYLTRYIQSWSITLSQIFESMEFELKEVYIL